ncbi:F0F1 ATP synthase subunit B [Eubacterium sp. AB3007]|uniref:F0F1 ATP synthase subunit B n=1 Tax=Eubacterium sp. AB3007 TaxID=1392487 RepID=UPI000481FAB0|nr:F0F1 ATP synthase subunit B [Eubacterium sp. AB3007]
MMLNHEAIMEFNLVDIGLSIITFLVLFLILKHFLFEKVHDFMEARTKEVEDSLNNAAETNRLADAKLMDYEERIANVESESRDIIKKARDEAKVQADTIVEEANEKARLTFEQSQAQIEREKFTARKELRQEVGALAAMAAGKILEKEVDAAEHQEIVDKIIEEAEKDPWN